jgi:hypothetical protein
MVDQFVEVVGGKPRNRVRGQGNTSSLVIRTLMEYRLDPSAASLVVLARAILPLNLV